MATRNPISGLLNIDKPKGLTSHDVVARVKKLSDQRKVGHTGTLDPMATGVLLVCLGQATRLIEYLMTTRKQYRAVIRFGTITDTLDTEGKIIDQADYSTLTEAKLKNILPNFLGEIQQIPPLFSALKKGGQPLYKRARAGENITLDPRPVTIYNLTWAGWSPPDLTLGVTCSSGTYIRALARDIGQAAGPGAHLAGLTRTANGPWTLEEAVQLETLAQAIQDNPLNWQKYLHPADQAITHLPKVVLDDEDASHVKHGRQIQLPAQLIKPAPANGHQALVRAYTPAGNFLAILAPAQTNDDIWQPKKVFQT